MNGKKLTKIVILIGLAIYIVYDIVILVQCGGSATLSKAILKWVYGIPFVGYGIAVIFGHFFSVIKVPYSKDRFLWILIVLSIIFLLLSFLPIHIPVVITLLIGFTAGSLLWAQRSKKKG